MHHPCSTCPKSMLEGAEADKFLAVSCGVSGYVPDAEEWKRNRDYFTELEG